MANNNNLSIADLSQAGIIRSDLIDGLHPGTSTGNLKIENTIKQTINMIQE